MNPHLKRFNLLGIFWTMSAVWACAHHPGMEQYPGHAAVAPQMFMDFGNARYRHDEISADVLSLGIARDWRVWERTSLGVRVSGYRIDPENQDVEYGFGDLDLNAKYRLKGGFGETIWVTGLGLELPTADEDKGFGGGHVEFSPFVAFVRNLESAEYVQIHGSLEGILSAKSGEHDHADAVNYVNPHEDKELRAHAGFSIFSERNVYANLVVTIERPLRGDHNGDWFLTLRPEVGMSLKNNWFSSLTWGLPLGDQRWYNYRVAFQLRKRLG